MSTELTKITPWKLPENLKEVGWPHWVEERRVSLKKEYIAGVKQPPRLPSSLLPTQEQSAEIEKFRVHILTKFPMYIGSESAAKTMAAISKMIMVLASKSSDELAMEAKGEAYMMALEDVQSWAVEEAARKWYRGEHGPEYDYKWMPDPATMRALAKQESSKVFSALMLAIDLSLAEPIEDEIDLYSDEHRTKMLEKLSNLTLELKSKEIH